MNCNICNSALGNPIYFAPPERTITSLNTKSPEPTIVWFCETCSHVMTKPIEDLDAFYSESYTLGMHSEDEDQLIKVENGVEIYRTDIQRDTLFEKLDVTTGARILDFGSGKAQTLKKLLKARPDLQGFAFDVSDHYTEAWQKFLPEGHYAAPDIPEDWKNTMDVSMSYFMLEHVPEPLEILKTQHEYLKEGGHVYFVIPYLYKNQADMLIADHINHFSIASLRFIMQKAGYENIDIDVDINPLWMVVSGQKTTADVTPDPIEDIEASRKEAVAIGAYWSDMSAQVEAFATKIPEGQKAAIYGAGFYGNFILENLPDQNQIACFVDRSEHMQGREHKGQPIIAPSDLDDTVQHVLVGINPPAAKSAIEQVAAWRERDLTYHYLF